MTEAVGYNLDAEIAVLGSILIDPRVFPEVRESLRVEDFASTLNQEIYRAAAALGLFLPGHESYTYHITLAYTRVVPQGEKKAALERAVEAMRTYLNAQGAFEVTPPYVAFYDGMLVFSAKRIAR